METNNIETTPNAPQGDDTVMAPKDAKLKFNLSSAQFRPWLVKVLKTGGVDAFTLVKSAQKEFQSQMIEGDLAPVYLGKQKKFTHAWHRRLYDSRKAMVTAGLMFASKHFPTRGNWWQLTPKGLLAEHKNGY